MIFTSVFILLTGFGVCLALDRFASGDLHGFYAYSIAAGFSASLFLKAGVLTNAPTALMMVMGLVGGYLGARIFFEHHCALSSESSAGEYDTCSSSCPE